MSDGGAQFKYLFLGSSFPGFTIDFYSAGTLTGKNVWVDETKSSAVQQVQADSYGMAVWYADGDHRMRVKDADGTLMWDWPSVKITSDSATMWEGNFGTSYPTATTANRWQMFAKVTSDNEFRELGINIGTQFIPITNVVDVKSYGAKCDGATLDTTAAQNAIDDLSAGIVTISNGTCLSNGITLKDNVYLYIAAGATLKQNGTGGEYSVKIQNYSNTGVFGEGTIDGNKANLSDFYAFGIYIYANTSNIENVFVKEITIKNISGASDGSSKGDGVHISGASDSATVPKNIKVINTHIQDCARNGITVITGEHNLVSGNTIDTMAGVGIDFEQNNANQYLRNNVVSSNVMRSCNRGIDIMGNDNLFDSNIIADTTEEGIKFAGNTTKTVKRNTASNNIIYTPTKSGIYIQDDAMGYNRILNNSVYNSSRYGIRVGIGTNNKYNEIRGNTVCDCPVNFNGICLDSGGAGYQDIRDNTIIKIDGAFASAIHLNSNGNNTLLNNKFIGSFTNEILGIAATDSVRQIDRIKANGNNFDVEIWQTGSTFTNNGATEIMTASLPAIIAGLTYTFVCVESVAFRIDPIASNYIRGGGQGKYVSLDTGEAITIKAVVSGGTYWDIINSNGSLSYEA